jgi:hypothetical protein
MLDFLCTPEVATVTGRVVSDPRGPAFTTLSRRAGLVLDRACGEYCWRDVSVCTNSGVVALADAAAMINPWQRELSIP